MITENVNLAGRSYPIFIGDNAFGFMACQMRDTAKSRRLVCVVDSAVCARGLNPREVAELGVGRAPYELDIPLVEFLFCRLEREDFRWADKCEVLGVEEEYDVFLSLELRQGEVAYDFSVHDGVCPKVGRLFAYER